MTMTDTLNNFGETLVNNLTNAAWTDLIIYGIGFIGFCILGSLLTRKDRKANPEKWARIDDATAANNATMAANTQDNPMGTVFIGGKMYTTTTVGNTTYIH